MALHVAPRAWRWFVLHCLRARAAHRPTDPAAPRATPTMAVPAPTPDRRANALLPLLLVLSCGGIASAQGKIDFQRQILPILEKSCIECHATAHTGPDGKLKKPKGGVALDHKDGFAAKKGLIVAGKPDASLLFTIVTLAADDEDRMPPAKKGDPLPAAQTALIGQWITEGASFGNWAPKKPAPAAAPAPESRKAGPGGADPKPRVDPLAKLQEGVKALPAATLAAFAEGPFLVASAGDGSPLLSVNCRGNADAITDAAVAALAPIASHVAELDLSRTRVGDEACKLIATMPRLIDLDLRQTAVGNQGVAALAACTELRSLNLFGTKTGDYGIEGLRACKHLEHLYLWQTDVTATAAVRLRDAIPGLRIVIGPEMPEPMPEGAGGGRRRR